MKKKRGGGGGRGEKSKILWAKQNIPLSTLPFNPSAASAAWQHVGASKNTGKMTSIFVFNKKLPRTHT
jgi:hypothetical protein